MRRSVRTSGLLALVGSVLAATGVARAEARSWSDAFPAVREDVKAGRPFVVHVVVPLCSNDQIDCGGAAAGRPGDLGTNLYWGAVFGMRRFFDRASSGWERVERVAPAPGEGPTLERVVYRRRVAGRVWDREEPVEQLVVLEAFHGSEIDRAVRRFWTLATEGGRVSFVDGERRRDERIHVAGYAGHNRLMDGLELPPVRTARPGEPARAPIPSFVFACHSQRYFGFALEAAGSRPLVMTRALMAPEAYTVDAMARGLGDGLERGDVRDGVVRAYAKWQRLSFSVASNIIAP